MKSSPALTVLFIGLGAMGTPMAARLAESMHLHAFDVRPDVLRQFADSTGARAVASLDDAPVSDIDIVIFMVPDSAVVDGVLLAGGLMGRLRPGTLIIDMGSSLPASTRRLAAAAADEGIGYVDAPVSGGTSRAQTGELAIMVGGSAADVDRALPLLDTLGTTIHRVGGPGAGHAAKALNNLLSATHIAAASEIVCAAEKFGIEPDVMVAILNSSTGRSQATEVKFPTHILPGTYKSGFRMNLMVKDIATAQGVMGDVGALGIVTAAAADVTRRAAEELDITDHTEVARWYAHTNGIDLTRPVKGTR